MEYELNMQAALQYLGLGESEARRAASTMCLIGVDPATKYFHDVVANDWEAIRLAFEPLAARAPAFSVTCRDEALVNWLLQPPSFNVNSATNAVRRLKDRLPIIAEWYGVENESRAKRVMALYSTLTRLLYWN